MEVVKTKEEAIEFLQKFAGINVEEITYKYKVWDNDFTDFIKTDEDLIEYAEEQRENILCD